MAEKKLANLLPEFLRTEKNAKFLSSTIDPLISTPALKRVDGYVGSKLTPNFNPEKDFYIVENSPLRQNYSLEPSLVFKNSTSKITDIVSYDDLINEIGVQGGKNSNLDSLFRSKYFSYDPLIDWDKLVNYSEYYWLPNGPTSILVDVDNLDVENDIIGQTEYTLPTGQKLTNGLMLRFLDNDVVGATPAKYRKGEYIVEGVGKSIVLINFSLLEAQSIFAQSYNETFDSDEFDSYPFDGDKKLPIDPEYVTINRASQDLNPWSRYNRWFHKQVLEITGDLDKATKARRPIVEFKPNLKLYNFGINGIKNVDLIDTTTKDAFKLVDGTLGYYVDGVLLEEGKRVIFNEDTDANIRGKIYEVKYDYSQPSPVLRLEEADDFEPDNFDSISVSQGLTYQGKSFYYNATSGKWILSQQHEKLNQAPLFDLFDSNGISYTEIADKNNFIGNKIFGYEIGTGANDEVLGFPLKYENSVGVGSYLFKNYFMTDEISITQNNVSKLISTGITYIKYYDNNQEILVNVWNKSLQENPIPVLEIKTVEETTTTFLIQSVSGSSISNLSVFVNNSKVKSYLNTSTNLVTFNTSTVLNVNDTVLLKISTTEVPNENGFYETPLNLRNNPFNNNISNFTLSELSDHVSSMIEKIPNFVGNFPGSNNLRDINDYGKYGSRLIINSNPIAFAKFFLGKKEHNVIDALRTSGIQYNQFKINLINQFIKVDEQLSARDALDLILNDFNQNRTDKSLYFSSDMLGTGNDKIVRTYTVTDAAVDEYPIGTTFDISKLSTESLLIYVNEEQLVYKTDYEFGALNDTVIFLNNLAVDDIIEVVYYKTTNGNFVPPTPTKLGLYPKFKPEIYDDYSFVGAPVKMIRGHDGSIVKAFDDYRDDLLLEFEKRIFNNIKVNYNKDIFDISLVTPSAFRSTTYSLADFNEIISKEFMNWAGTYGVSYTENSTFDVANSFTWNFKNVIDTLSNETFSGSWKSLFKYFYDTVTPHKTPWEMFGYIEKPMWWESIYGTYYGSTNTWLWSDAETGYNRYNGTYNTKYARPGLSSIIPVNAAGNLKNPETFLVVNVDPSTINSSWLFGEWSPAETAWRNSSFYPFALNIAAALLQPSNYTSSMFDTSRSDKNILGQVTYLEDDLYLNLKKLVVPDGTNLTSGFSVYISEHGKQKNQNYINNLKQDLNYLDFNLFHKLGGFSSKEKLQINIDSIDPVSRSPGVILPYEDYTLLLNVSNPIQNLNISGIIIQKNNGKFLVRGYDKLNPYFEIFPVIKTSTSGVVTVGGKSEKFSEWSSSQKAGASLSSLDTTTAQTATTRYYKQGQIVRYNNIFYRVKIGHVAEDVFDPTYYQQLSSLPVKGGVTVQQPSTFKDASIKVAYGTEFSSVQEVYDFILGYGKYLESLGFVFDYFNKELNEVINWKFSAKEFLYWTTQNWADNNLIAISPFADTLKFKSAMYIVDNIKNAQYDYKILKTDGKLFPQENVSFSREDDTCTVTTVDTDDSIFFANLRLIQKEHGIVINNSTIFNDTIYDIETGYKQARIKLSGFITKDWNGDFFSPGFIYDDPKVVEWESYKFYLPGAIVRFNGSYYQANEKVIGTANFDFTKWVKLNEQPVADLIPNFDYKINQFEDFYSLDVDNFDFSQQQLAQHLIGYTPRTYLNNIFNNPISQYKFYQGLIKEKGTKNSIDKIAKASLFNNQGDITFNEEWAFRVGHYGGYSSYNEIEFNLEEGSYLENPYIVKFVDSVPSNSNPLVNYVLTNNLLLQPDDYTTTSTFFTTDDTFDSNNNKLLTAGYVRLDDVTATAFNKNSILDIANNSQLQDRSTIWLGFLENGDWTVYRYAKQIAKITGVYVSSPGTEITFVTSQNHDLSVGDIVSVVEFNEQVNGVYIVSRIPKLNQFAVESVLATITDDDLVSPGTVFKFENSRFSNFSSLSSYKGIFNLKNDDKIWVDNNEDSKWVVLQKVDNYSDQVYDSINIFGGQQLGKSIYTDQNSSVFLSSVPGQWSLDEQSIGKIIVYQKSSNTLLKQFEYTINNNSKIYCQSSTATDFGVSLAYDDNKKLFFAGAPLASKIRASSTGTGVVLSTGTGTAKIFDGEGLVKISSKNITIDDEVTELVLCNPNAITTATAQNSNFGKSLYINSTPFTTATTLLVGAPGGKLFAGTGQVYAYYVNTVTSTSTGITVATVGAHPSGLTVNSTSTISLNSQSKWGETISGSRSGSIIAISAPGYISTTSNKRGVVQIFDQNLKWRQTLLSPFSSGEIFGDKIFVSKSGNYILISSVKESTINKSLGKVVVYKSNNTGVFEIVQVLENPIYNSDLKFGSAISMSDDENTIVVSSLGTNRSQVINFSDETTFDGNSTFFVNDLLDAGSAFVYSKLGDTFIGAYELNDTEILQGSKYGYSVIANNNIIYVGAPSSKDVGILSLELVNDVTVSLAETLQIDIADPQEVEGNKPIFEIIYKNVTSTTKTVDYISVIYPGSGYRYIPIAVLKDSLGTVLDTFVVTLQPDDSKIYQFTKIDSSINGYKVLRQQENSVDISKIKRVCLIDTVDEEIIDYLDVVDPLKGKIPGLAEQEIKFKSITDPAVYSLGKSFNIIDTESNWLDDHVGELWWDLSTSKFIWYEQGDDVFRKNNWGKLFPGSNVDVYEWVKSTLLPSEWAEQADTNDGLTKGISGQPKYPDNSVISAKQVYNNVTGSFENVYYYWVKNKTLIPSVKNRRISSYQVASLIADPLANGIKFAQILSKDSLTLANVQPMLVGNKINANIVIDLGNELVPRHTEWLLLEEGNKNSIPNVLLEKKLFDSLLGHDLDGNAVPDTNLTDRNRYGIGIRPQQTLFRNRLEALRNIVEFANSVLEKNLVTGNYNFDNLNKEDSIPSEQSGEYDAVFQDNQELEAFDSTNIKRALVECFISNGKIRNVVIRDQGYGYLLPPQITVVTLEKTEIELKTQIDSQGRVVFVEIVNPGKDLVEVPTLEVRPHTVIIASDSTANNKWSKNTFNYTTKQWIKVKTQSYDTPRFWEYIDWKNDQFNLYKPIKYVIPSISDLPSLYDAVAGDYVKISNIGDGRYVILEKLPTGSVGNFTNLYNIVFSENGTIKIKDNLWNFSLDNFSYDDVTLEETLYDEIPDLEIYYILSALKNDIFVQDLKVNWNLLFFVAIKYALTEQKILDWAFKTSFINIENEVGTLNQRPVYKLDNDEYFEDYIKEIKPYRTKIRNFISKYSYLENYGGTADEASSSAITDFDLPSIFNSSTQQYEIIDLNNPLIDTYPWKWWKDNYTYSVDQILIANPGSGYIQRPTVVITTATGDTGSGATAEAYIRQGKIYQIIVTNKGSGYKKAPIVSIVSTASIITTATASAVISNNPIRKNLLGVKFDRVSTLQEIGNLTFTETFECDGITDKFELSWLAEPDKQFIVAQLDGKTVFATDYSIEFFSKEENDYKKKFCRFVFLNYVPLEGQTFKITYRKNLKLYQAIDRIENLYNPNEDMPGHELPLLMNGTEFPNTVIQGLPLSYAVPWNPVNNPYGSFVWDELVENYASAKIVSTVTVGSDVIYLSTTSNVVPGQLVNILNSSTSRVRTGTVVSAVFNSYIQIENPTYKIKSARATSTSTGSVITIKTINNFYGNLKIGDKIFVKNVGTAGYNGQFLINTIDDNNAFQILSTGTLAATTSSISTLSEIQLIGILDIINSDDNRLAYIESQVKNTTSTTVETFVQFSEIVKEIVNVNSSAITKTTSTVSTYYSVIEEATGRASIVINNLSTSTNNINVSLFGNPEIEFWKYNKLQSGLDTAISAGSWNTSGNFIGALGVLPEDIDITGDTFVSSNVGFGPEELVPAHILDSVGINVYTKSNDTNAMMITGAFSYDANTTTTIQLSVFPEPTAGLLVHGNGQIFNRSTSTTFSTLDFNEFYLYGNTIIIPPQPSAGRGGYSVVTCGGTGVIDGNVVVVENQTTALVESLASIEDIKQAYVMVDGKEIFPVTTTTSYGYMLTNVSPDNNRACVKVYNLPAGVNTIEAWFLNQPYNYFNRVREEIIVVTATQSTFVLNSPPANLEPVVASTIVEKTDAPITISANRRRLIPPYISYYKIENGQTRYAIDNKVSHSSGYFSIDEVKVYVNGGPALNPGFDYVIEPLNNEIVLASGLLDDGDVIAIMAVKDNEFVITGNLLTLTTPMTQGSLRVITFTNHDNLLIQSERFNVNDLDKRFTVSRPIINDNYVWVYNNEVPLLNRYDFEILDDYRTIRLSDSYNLEIGSTILVTYFATPKYENQLLGYRIFKDLFDKVEFKRLAEYHSTFLTRDLEVTDTEIYVQNDNRLITPNPALNKPGVILIDAERIEYFEKNGNVLSHLRRGTLGTAPARYSQIGTTVIDQSIQQRIPYVEHTYVQRIQSSNSTTYNISLVASTSTGDGIILSSIYDNSSLLDGVDASNQVAVYYGGHQLRKDSLLVHDMESSYNPTAESLIEKQPEFSVTLSINTSLALTYATTSLQMVVSLIPVDLAYDLDGDGAVTLLDATQYLRLASGYNLTFAPNTASNYANLIGQELVLNISERITTGTEITIVQKIGTIWTGTQSLLDSNVPQARFLRDKQAKLPDVYYYGGDPTLLDDGYYPLLDENDNPLEEY